MKELIYKLSKRGKVQFFELETVPMGTGYVLRSRKGYIDGAVQEDLTPISPKNVGRANETTPEKQAEVELLSKLGKLGDKGYKKMDPDDYPSFSAFVEKLETLQGTDINGNKLPMLAQKNIDRIILYGYLQRKYDGMRGVTEVLATNKTIRSRNGKFLDNLGHILDELKDIPEGWALDGELYAHGFPLQDIVSMTKRAQPNNIKIKFRVYDVMLQEPYEERRLKLRDYLDSLPQKHVEYVPTYRVDSWEQIDAYFKQWREDGYEGAMWRDPKGLYECGQRSWGLIKIKDFDENEFEIVDVEEATGRDEGTAIFVCMTDDDIPFNVRPMGTRAQRREYLDNFDEYDGKMLTVRHQGWTKEGKPFHARGVVIRDYE